MKRILAFLLFICNSHLLSASFQMNENMQHAYLAIIDLQFEKGQSFIDLEKQHNSQNGLIQLTENYIDFLSLIIGEERQLFRKISSNKNKRLAIIEKCDKDSPYYLYAKAEINLQWAFARLKFQEYFLATYEIQKAYFLLQRNQEQFPDFHLNKKGMGLLHCLIGSIPENYQRIVNSIGIDGRIKQGLTELDELLFLTNKNENYKCYNTELLFLISFLEMNLTIDKDRFQNSLKGIGEKYKQHILLNFAAARLSTVLGKNELTIHILKNRPHLNGQYHFTYLDYLMGMSYLYKLDFENSKQKFELFLSSFKGENYIKSTYHKLAWIAFLTNDIKMQAFYFERTKSIGESNLDEDKQALKQAKTGKIPHPTLLKSRLFYDGGYYQKSLDELKKIEKQILFSDNEDTIEFWYRKGRVSQKLARPLNEILSYFSKSFALGAKSTSYFSSMSALQIAIEYEKNGEYKDAESFYKKCLSMKGFDYQRGIHQKAKAGLDRIAN
ncbi:MAG: hypothetical protein VYD71_02075 [Bacteroidota bacterium]|nr:hypothetical protein [Bacteroidota bacterium]